MFLLAWLFCSAVAIAAFGPEHALLAVGLGGGAVGALSHPAFAISLLIGNLLMRPWEAFPDGNSFEILPRGLAVLCMVSLILEHVRSARLRINLGLPLLLFGSLALWLYLSALFSFRPSESASYLITAFIPAGVVIFVMRNAVLETWCIRVCETSFALAVFVVAICSLIYTGDKQFLFSSGVRLEGFGQWGNSNDLAALFATALPIIALRGAFSGRLSHRAVFGYMPVGILGLSLLLTQSRGGLMALFGSLLPYLYDRRRKPAVLFGFVAGVISLVLLSTILFTRNAGELEGSKMSRLNYVIVGLKMLKTSPLVGIGPGNYPVLYDNFSTDFAEYGLRTAHSCWVLILAEGGIPGFLLFGAIFTLALRSALKTRSEYPELLMSFIAYFIAVSFLSQSYSLATYFMFALALAASQTGRKDASS